MLKLLDRVFALAASLKMAIVVILLLAFYLATATFYEKYYGSAAVAQMIYGSPGFILIMAMLSINVLAAVLIRYPWKRKQTGFIITHAGIEMLLFGCLLSFHFSVDGKLVLVPGFKAEQISLNNEDLRVVMPDLSGKLREHIYPVNLWSAAGYPGMLRFISYIPHMATEGPVEAHWPQGKTITWDLGPGARLDIESWLAAAVEEQVIKKAPGGFPAAMVHLGGAMPNGMLMDQSIGLIADGHGGGMQSINGGLVAIDLWKARSADEVNEFIHPPEPSTLPAMGRLALYLGGKRYAVDISDALKANDVPIAGSAYSIQVMDYQLNAPPVDGSSPTTQESGVIEPNLVFRLTGPQGSHTYRVDAWHPQFMALLDNVDTSQHVLAGAADPLVYYAHPQAYFTAKGSTLGRLQLLCAPDGQFYMRGFKLKQLPTQTPETPVAVEVGKELPDYWARFLLAITAAEPSGILADEYREAHIEPSQMELHPRAMKIALDVDGQRQETWVARGNGDAISLNTPRGTVQIDYSNREYPLGFVMGLEHAEQTNDPGSTSAAAYASAVTVSGTAGNDGQHTISMNNPLTASGLTFYQGGFDNSQGVAISTLLVRKDPGWVFKYAGCAMIVGGIFTMFYMKAYFQKTPALAPSPNDGLRQPDAVMVAAES